MRKYAHMWWDAVFICFLTLFTNGKHSKEQPMKPDNSQSSIPGPKFTASAMMGRRNSTISFWTLIPLPTHNLIVYLWKTLSRCWHLAVSNELLQHKNKMPQQTKIHNLSVSLCLVTWWTSSEIWKTAKQYGLCLTLLPSPVKRELP